MKSVSGASGDDERMCGSRVCERYRFRANLPFSAAPNAPLNVVAVISYMKEVQRESEKFDR